MFTSGEAPFLTKPYRPKVKPNGSKQGIIPSRISWTTITDSPDGI